MPPAMNHRCGGRRDFGLTVLARRRGWSGCFAGSLRDFSISGAFLQMPAGTFPLRAVVHLEVTLPGSDPRPMYCRAMVVRVAGDGVGLVFDQVRPASLKRLFAWAECATPDQHRRVPPGSRAGPVLNSPA